MLSDHEEYALDGIEELPPEVDAQVTRMIVDAERDWEETRWGKVRQVVFDWRQVHLDAVVRAAELMGIPWRDYIKQAAFRQAMGDLAAAPRLPGTADLDTSAPSEGASQPFKAGR